MNVRTRRILTVLRAILHEIRTERITFMAGSIAYHAFVSLLPLLLLLLAVVSAVGDPGVERSLIALTEAALTPGAGDVLVAELRSTSAGVSVLGLAVLVWGTLRIFRGLDTAFSDIYESEAENTLLDQFRDALLVFGSVGAAIVVGAVLESALGDLALGPLTWPVQRAVLVVGLAVAFLPMYYVFPDQDGMSVVEVLPGVGFVAVGLTAFESLFRVYLTYSSTAESGTLLSGILVFLTWLYFSGLVVLVGVAVNAVLSNRSRDVDIRPVLGGVPRETAASGTDGAANGTGGTVGNTDRAVRATLDREALLAAVDRLGEILPTATEVTVTVDGESVELPPPERVEVDLRTSRLPFVSDPVGITLRWSPDRE